ncbi:MAG: hypothetical protein H6674_09395 [Dehalococcoidia bacterium]|nr:hypothetical protein [Dehalococcoidia bacterium]
MRGLTLALLLVSSVSLAPDAAARGSNVHTFTQTGNVYDGNGGPWLTGHVYLLKALQTVPSGQTLTIQPGAIVKFDTLQYLTVVGTLQAVGAAGSPIWFTSLKDDAVGGDHNGDGGATTPKKGDWRYVQISLSSTGSVMQWCHLRYGGYFGSPTIYGLSSTFSLLDSVVEDGNGAGLEIGYPSVVVERNLFSGCKRPIAGATVKGVHRIVDNSASNNVDGDVLRVGDGGAQVEDFTSSATWSTANSLNGTGEFIMTEPIQVKAPATLTLQAGVTLLWEGPWCQLIVRGTLLSNGTAAAPVVMTSIGDPDFGGAGAAPGDWNGLDIYDSDATTLTHTEFRYAGGGNYPGIRISSSDLSMTNCRVAHSANEGVTISACFPTISGCAFDDNGTYAIGPVPLDVLSGFAGNTASGNGSGDAIALGGGTLSGAFTLGPASAFNGTGAFILSYTLTVGSAGHLTLAPGVILKADPAGNPALNVSGTLTCNGTAAAPVVLTSYLDDSVGGDLNADGAATTPSPGDWLGVRFYYQSDASSLTHTTVRYAGTNGSRSIYFDSADITLTDCAVEYGAGPAMQVMNSAPTVTGCRFDYCGGAAPIVELPLASVAGFSGNTAQGNAKGDVIRFASSQVAAAVTVKKANSLNGTGVFAFDGFLNVSGGHLTLEPGVVLKFSGADLFSISGPGSQLTAVGTAQEPVVLTSIGDDAYGGDTEKDGPTTGQAGDWEGISAFLAQAVTLQHAVVRNTGANDAPAVLVNGAALTMDHVIVEDAAGFGFRQTSSSDLPLVTNCAFDRCKIPVYGVSVSTLQGWSGNTANQCTLGDAVRFFNSGPSSALALTKAKSLNGAGVFVAIGYWDVNAGTSVTIGPGVTIKVESTLPVDVYGTLTTNGTTQEPVCFTSRYDDAYGGDSNGDGGATTPAPGDWVGLAFWPNSAASTLNHTLIRYAGQGGAAAVALDSADITLCNVKIEKGAGPGIDANGNSAPTVKNVSIDDNGGLAIDGVTWGILGKMSGASASGNQGGDYTYIDSPHIGGDLVIHRESVLGSCIVVNVSPAAWTGSLSFGRGVIVKATGPHVLMEVKDVLGTGLEKVVFTSFHDDDHGGDSDQSTTAPAPGDWQGVKCGGKAEHALVRYAGAVPPGGTAPHVALSAGGTANAPGAVGCRAELSAGDGISVVFGRSLVAFQNGGVGIHGGTIWSSTMVGNGSYGFGSLSIGKAYGCISWMNGPNGTENYQYSGGYVLGPPGCDVVWSCGTTLGVGPGTGWMGNCGSSGWGNFYADPRFVNAPAGDLRLKADSPCRNFYLNPCPPSVLNDNSICNPFGINGLNYPGPPESTRDYLEQPRSVDDDLLGPAPKRGDLGAYERPVYTLAPIGEPIIGDVVTLHCVGPAGTATYLLGFDGNDPYLSPYGYLLIDPLWIFVLVTLPVGTPLPMPIIDDPILEGLEVNIQAAVQSSTGAVETTNVWRPRFHR